MYRRGRRTKRTSTLEVLHAFRDEARHEPIAPVVADASGNLYGETFDFAKPDPNGGCGTVFKLMPSRGSYVETTLHRFQNKPDGCSPDGGLAMDSSGALYGTTDWGGRTPGLGAGTVFKLTPVGSGYRYRVVYRFKDHRDGAWPTGGVILDRTGLSMAQRNMARAMPVLGTPKDVGRSIASRQMDRPTRRKFSRFQRR